MWEGYCEKGVTVRHLRRAVAQEVRANPRFLTLIEQAAGGELIEYLGLVDFKNHGTNLNLAFETRWGAAGRIWLDVEIDELRNGDISRYEAGAEPVIKTRHVGDERVVTMAPEIWFKHQGNAESAVNALTFEVLREVASDEMSSVLWHGIHRAHGTFKRLTRPKREIPRWVLATARG